MPAVRIARGEAVSGRGRAGTGPCGTPRAMTGGMSAWELRVGATWGGPADERRAAALPHPSAPGPRAAPWDIIAVAIIRLPGPRAGHGAP